MREEIEHAAESLGHAIKFLDEHTHNHSETTRIIRKNDFDSAMFSLSETLGMLLRLRRQFRER